MSDPAYKMQPAGHDAPAPRRNYAAPDSKLKNLFEGYLGLGIKIEEGWKGSHPSDIGWRLYEFAIKYLENLQFTPEEAHGLLLERELDEKERWRAGFFLSAIYNKSEQDEILYDLEIKVGNIAYCLPEGKAFISTGLCDDIGTGAKGIIINYAKGRQGHYGLSSILLGPMFCYGHDYLRAKENFPALLRLMVSNRLTVVGYESSKLKTDSDKWYDSVEIEICKIYKSGTFVNYIDPRVIAEKIHKVSECRQYIDNLVSKFAKGRKDYRIVLETLRNLGPKPHKKIRQDITDMLRRAGEDV